MALKRPKIVYLDKAHRGKNINNSRPPIQQKQPIKNFRAYITSEIHASTTETWTQKSLGKFYSYPSASYLATAKNSFGTVSRDHSFTLEPSFENIIIYILKSQWLSYTDYLQLLSASPLYMVLWAHLQKFKSVDFSPLR